MVIDLTHYIKNNMMIYPGDPEIEITQGLIHDVDGCHVDRIKLNTHLGTHIDAPFHFFPEGKKISDYEAGRFICQGLALDLRGMKAGQAIERENLEPLLDGKNVDGMAVAIITGWDEKLGSDEYLDHLYLSEGAAKLLVERGIGIVAVDFLNVDSTLKNEWLAHPVLLGADTLIVENLNNRGQLEFGREYTFSFLPLKIEGSDGSPVRAVAY